MRCDFEASVEPAAEGGLTLTVNGSVTVSNPGVTATFAERVPPGMNPDLLLMTLVLEAQPQGHAPIPTERALAFRKTYPAGARLPARVEIHTTSGETFGCTVARGH